MSNDAEMWAQYKKMRQAKRASNRESSADVLTREGIRFTSHNNGAHLIVEGKDCFIDFWPGTGKWHSRNGVKGLGVMNLVKEVKP